MYPDKTFDNVERAARAHHRHARVHDQLASDAQYAGGIGWCAFDYNTHDNFGSGDRICYHGVADIFRIPKPAAGFYKSQCDPSEEIVLEPAFHWARGDENEGFTNALVCSNCEKLKYFVGSRMIAEVEPDRKTYPSLKYAPFTANLRDAIGKGWEDLRIEGYIGGKMVIERKMSAKGVDQAFVVEADDKELVADGIDMTRVVFASPTSSATRAHSRRRQFNSPSKTARSSATTRSPWPAEAEPYGSKAERGREQ